MNIYYITTQKTFEDNIHDFHPILGAHYINLNNDEILLSAHFLSHGGLNHWELQKDVIPLPHPIFQGTEPISDDLLEKLSALGVKTGHTILDVAEKSGNLHSLMKLR